MGRLSCLQLRAQLQEIKSLKRDFDVELANLNTTRNTAPAFKLGEYVRERLVVTKESVHVLTIENQIKEAQKILDSDFLGLDAIEETFGFKSRLRDTPLIPFSLAEIERAKELGQFLVLRVDKTPDGRPLTMKKMNEIKGGKTNNREGILWENDESGQLKEAYAWYNNEKFFKTDTPSTGWALVSKEVIPSSKGKNYLEQTKEMVNYLEAEVCRDRLMPVGHKEAIDEFKQVKEEIESLVGNNNLNLNLELVCKKLSKLKITQLFRHTPSEFLYDSLLRKEKTGMYLSRTSTVTKCQSAKPEWVSIGYSSAPWNGLCIGRQFSSDSSPSRGVCFSCSR